MSNKGIGGAALAVIATAAAFSLASAQPVPPAEVPPQETAPAPVPPPVPPNATPGGAPTPPPPEAAAPVIAPLPEEQPARPAAPSAPPPTAAAKPPPPPRRTLYTAAVIQVLDKVTAENLRFEAPLHKPIRYKGLIFQVNTCQSGTPDQPTPAAHLEIDSQPPALPGRPENPVKMVYRGWMFADTPGPHPFEHPVYDAWLIACKTASGGA